MKKSKFTDAQIAFTLKQVELGTLVEELCRKIGISDATFYNWKKNYGGPGPSELRQLRRLQEESTKLKRSVADLSQDKAISQNIFVKKALKPPRKRTLIDDLRDRYRIRLTRECGHISRSLYAYKSVARRIGIADVD